MFKEWLRIKDVPEYCGISERLVYKWFDLGLPFSRIGGTILIKAEDLNKFIKKNTIDNKSFPEREYPRNNQTKVSKDEK
ncbi:helix-turn-helix domain-containing protein [Candidatus Latescibacterota bacterium]